MLVDLENAEPLNERNSFVDFTKLTKLLGRLLWLVKEEGQASAAMCRLFYTLERWPAAAIDFARKVSEGNVAGLSAFGPPARSFRPSGVLSQEPQLLTRWR
jgi:hypothetical protein